MICYDVIWYDMIWLWKTLKTSRTVYAIDPFPFSWHVLVLSENPSACRYFLSTWLGACFDAVNCCCCFLLEWCPGIFGILSRLEPNLFCSRSVRHSWLGDESWPCQGGHSTYCTFFGTLKLFIYIYIHTYSYILYNYVYILYVICFADFHGGSTWVPEHCSNKFQKPGGSCDILPGTCSRGSAAIFLRSLKKRSGRDESEMRRWAILRCIHSTPNTRNSTVTLVRISCTVCLLLDGFMGCEWAVRMQMVQLQRHCGGYW